MSAARELTTTVAAFSRVTGNIDCSGRVVVDGQIKGDGRVKGIAIVSTSGEWHGNIDTDIAIVDGVVHGDVTARIKLELRPTARVMGNVRAAQLHIQSGAVLSGQVNVAAGAPQLADMRTRNNLPAVIKPIGARA